MVDVNDGGQLRSYEREAINKNANVIEAVLEMMNEKRKLVDPVEWFQENVGSNLFRFVLTHPDKDHMSGIRRLLNGELTITNFWDIPHSRTRTRADYSSDGGWSDWQWYDAFRKGSVVSGVTWPKRLELLRGAAADFYAADGIEILSPTKKLVTDCAVADVYNNASYVLRQRHTTSSVLLAGDVETKAWEDMIAAGIDLHANVLVASHHGRKSGFDAEAMRLIRPEVVIVSTAKLPPEHDALPQYRYRAPYVFSTRTHGSITIRMHDGGQLEIWAADGTQLVSLVDRPVA